METATSTRTNVLKAEAELNGDAGSGGRVSEADVRTGSDGHTSGPAPVFGQGGRGEGGVPAQALNLPLGDDAMRFREPDLLEQRDVSR